MMSSIGPMILEGIKLRTKSQQSIPIATSTTTYSNGIDNDNDNDVIDWEMICTQFIEALSHCHDGNDSFMKKSMEYIQWFWNELINIESNIRKEGKIQEDDKVVRISTSLSMYKTIMKFLGQLNPPQFDKGKDFFIDKILNQESLKYHFFNLISNSSTLNSSQSNHVIGNSNNIMDPYQLFYPCYEEFVKGIGNRIHDNNDELLYKVESWMKECREIEKEKIDDFIKNSLK